MNNKKWMLVMICFFTFCISWSINADVEPTFVSKDGLYGYELEKYYGDTSTYDVAVLTKYFGNEKIVRIPATIDGYPVHQLLSIFSNNSVDKIYLPDSVRSVEYLFEGNDKIKEIEIIGNEFWLYCLGGASLEKVKISGAKGFAGDFFSCKPSTIDISGDLNSLSIRNNENLKELSCNGSIDGLNLTGCTQLETVTLPENSTNIEVDSFKYCYNLKTINYGGSLCQWKKMIETKKPNDVDWLANVKVNCAKGDSHSYGTPVILKKATCIEAGQKETVCKDCGYTITETIPVSTTHTYGDWNITKEATFNSTGSQQRICSVCEKKETKTIKKLTLKAGLLFEDPVSGCKYKVLNDKSKICCLAPLNKKVISVTIPDTVSYKGVKFKVSAIGNKSFSGCNDLVIVNIGKNISSIGSNAFSNCGMLCRIYVKSSLLTKVGTKALTGTDSDLVIRVPKKKLTAYKKLFNNKGQSKDTKVQGVA